MPIYEYNCNGCGNQFETLVMGSSKPQCPTCDSDDLKRLMSACGFVSKSSGGPGGAPEIKTSAGSSACGSCSAGSCSSCSVG